MILNERRINRLYSSYQDQRPKIGLSAFVLCAVILVSLSLNSPITFDEAFNWNFYRESTVFGVISDYSVSWNNQVPFTLLQQLISPEMISSSPWFIRLFSTSVGTVLVGLVIYQSTKVASRVFLPILLALGSPMIISYLFIARSYSLTALLCTTSFLLTSRVTNSPRSKSVWLLSAVIPLAVAIWALPTVIYLVPGFLLFQFLRRDFCEFLAQFLFLSLLIVASFASTFTKMIQLARNNPWSGSPSFFEYANEFSFQWIFTSIAICLLLAPYITHSVRLTLQPYSVKKYVSSMSRQGFIALSTICTGLSYFALTYFAYLIGMGWPFPRNAVAPIWLVILGVSVLPPITAKRAKLIYPLLFVTASLGFSSLASELNNGDWRRINPVLTETVPVAIRDLEQNGVSHIVCSSFDAPVCILAIGLLQAQNISMQLGDNFIPDLPCVIGKQKPSPQWQVRLYKSDQLWGQLCH